MRFCNNCGKEVNLTNEGYYLCSYHLCKKKHYINPIVGVSGIHIQDGKILLGKRSASHKNGKWCIPCGHIEQEDIVMGLYREFKEETSLTPTSIKLYCVISNEDDDYKSVGVYYRIFKTSGILKASDDLSEARYFSISDIFSIDLAFSSDEEIIKRLIREELIL